MPIKSGSNFGIFFDACRLRLRSDVPIGTALSGGLDSASVHCAIMNLGEIEPEVRRRPQSWRKAFVASFPGTAQDETPYAQAVIDKTGAEGIIMPLDPNEIIENIERITFSQEALFDNPNISWAIYREQRKRGCVVSLDGHGGDELLAGYHFTVQSAVQHAESQVQANELKQTYEDMVDPGMEGAGEPTFNPHTYLKVPPIRPTYTDQIEDKRAIQDWHPVDQMLYEQFTRSTLPAILHNFDRASMAHGVEIRSPFLDWRLVTFMFALPWTYKLAGGYSKALLRDALRDILPTKIVDRKSKLGLVAPLKKWLLDKPLRSYALDLMASQDFQQCPLWDGPAFRTQIAIAMGKGDGTTARTGWPFIQASILMKTFKEEALKIRSSLGQN